MTTTTITIASVQTMTRKELQATAKEMNIKANQKSAVLIEEITKTITPIEAPVVEVEVDEYSMFLNDEEEEVATIIESMVDSLDENDLDAQIAKVVDSTNSYNEDDDFFNDDVDYSASEASSPVKPAPSEKATNEVSGSSSTKTFEYIRSNNLGVVFMQKGTQVKIGWDPALAKPFIKVGNQPRKLMSIQTAIDKFKRFNNVVHGDVARIVKALVRIRKMPSQVLAQQKQRKRASLQEQAAKH